MTLPEKRMASCRLAAKEVFGFDSLRPFQESVLAPLCEKRDTLAVTATGGGKSLCFQLPALVLPGPAVVVSPLISLMKDQVDKLRALGVRACRMSSDVPRSEQVPPDEMASMDLIYASPEKLATPGFQKALKGVRLGMVALDEAHVAVTWGKDFRSSYAHLRGFVDQHPEAVRFACTATADDEVEVGIRSMMGLRDPRRVVTSPWRDNINYIVRKEAGFSELVDLVSAAQAQPGSQIVYVSSRRVAEEVSQRLRDSGLDAGHYHAGMNPAIRTQVQNRFMAGALRCAVATSAFGMGVDKSDIRLIAHWHMPPSLFNYLQETGRASRDGLPATAWLNIGKDAEKVHNYFIECANPEHYVYQRMWGFLTAAERQPVRVPTAILARASGVSERMSGQIDSALAFLEYTGHVKVSTAGVAYELPIINSKVAASVVRTIRGARISRGAVHYEPQDGEPDHHMRFVTAGACRFVEPSEIVSVDLLRRDLRLTPNEVMEKKRGAKMKLLMLHRFSDSVDRKGFVEALFSQRETPVQETANV
jgi:RecQ family ATP-dependent DNA helicase